MKRILITILFSLLLGACDEVFNKPFTITSKYPLQNNSLSFYTYRTNNGKSGEFIDSFTKYSIGDTIN